MIAFEERVTFLASTRLVTALCVCVGCIVCVCDCKIDIRELYMQVLQHTHTYKAVTGLVEAKNLLSRRRQLDCHRKSYLFMQLQWVIIPYCSQHCLINCHIIKKNGKSHHYEVWT